MDAAVLLVFALVHLGMIVGGAPALALDRTGVALLGAIGLLAAVAGALSALLADALVPAASASRSAGGRMRVSACR